LAYKIPALSLKVLTMRAVARRISVKYNGFESRAETIAAGNIVLVFPVLIRALRQGSVETQVSKPPRWMCGSSLTDWQRRSWTVPYALSAITGAHWWTPSPRACGSPPLNRKLRA
jgi:hypothetical protein